MRIAIIATDIPDYSIEFAEMVAREQLVYLICPEDFVATNWLEKNNNLKIYKYSRRRHRDPRSIIWVITIARLIKRLNVDIVHVLSEGQVWLNLLPLILPRVPIITTVHDIALHPGDKDSGRIPRISINRFIRRSSAIIVHGDTLKAIAHKTFGISFDRIFALPHLPLLRYVKIATDHHFEKPKDGKFRILFFGRIYEYKGLRYLIDAAASIKEQIPNASFIIAGRGDDLAPYYARMRDRGWFDMRNHFVPDLEASRLFAEADLIVLPYTEASESGVLAMAIGFAIPVVATSVGEMAVTVKENDLGEIVPPADPVALADAIAKLSKNDHRRAQISAHCNMLTRDKWSRQCMTQKVFGIYKSVVHQSR
jgi:glycosyltransferase involved in cell wall biosynthesis